MSERDDLFDLREAFGLVDALKSINSCESILALNALKGTIDHRITELEQAGRLIEQKGEEAGQKPLETGQTPLKTGQTIRKTGRGRKPDESLSPLNFLDIVLQETPDPFTRKDVSDVLFKHYNEKLKHDIDRSSADAYAYNCIKKMLFEGLIKKTGTQDLKGRGRGYTLYKKKTKKIVPEGVVDGIYVGYEDNRKKIRDNLAQERDLCGTGQSNGDVIDDGA